MTIQVRRKGQVQILDLAGKLTIGRGDLLLRKTFLELLQDGERLFIINLKKVTWVDSAGIGEIVACYKRARERNGMVKILIRKTGRARKLFVITLLDRVFALYTDEEEAIVSFIAEPVAG